MVIQEWNMLHRSTSNRLYDLRGYEISPGTAAEKTIHKTCLEINRRPPVELKMWQKMIVKVEYRKNQWDPTNGTKLRSLKQKRAIIKCLQES